ncbi:hypothetical protein [Alkalibacillus haloalkaliphilus]|uniref:Uncharacterized protein n=1 Tax=Alkalibacillus haloalkaliphilus TaxID=94136 RepID=A0A511W6D3_9BACI|nr:hypothetical protein [Alkalibacillus haloalkaliphilus]GEN46646.1 hypothetical protein AHA02nite_24220 [Alkalibacillus haloalkaliphilus]
MVIHTNNKNKESIDPKKKGVFEEDRTPLHEHKDSQLTDEPPLEDVKIEERNQKQHNKKKSQNTSQSERKYKKGK